MLGFRGEPRRFNTANARRDDFKIVLDRRLRDFAGAIAAGLGEVCLGKFLDLRLGCRVFVFGESEVEGGLTDEARIELPKYG